MSLIQRQQFNPATGRVEVVFVDTDTGQIVGTYGGAPTDPTSPLALPGRNAGLSAGIQEGGNAPNLATPSNQIPQGGFAGQHPRTAGFLQALGPALQALNFAPQEPTPYPVTGFSQLVRSIGQGAQTYGTAKENIQTARVKRATKKAAEPGLQKLEAGGSATQMTPDEQYGLQLAGLPAPQTALSGAERREKELADAGIQLSAKDKALLQRQDDQIKAERDYRNRLLGIQETEAETAAGRAEQEKFRDRLDFVRSTITSGIPAGAAMDLYNSLYLDHPLSPETEKTLQDNPSANLIRAQAAAAVAANRGKQMVQDLSTLIDKKPGLTDDQKLEAKYAIFRIQTLTDNPSIFLYNNNAQNEYEAALKTIERLIPEAKQAVPDSKAWFSRLWDAARGAIGQTTSRGAEEKPQPTGSPASGGDRAEYDNLVREAQAAGGKLPSDKAARLRELAAKLKGQ